MDYYSKPLFTITIGEFKELTKELIDEEFERREQEFKKLVTSVKEEHFTIGELASFLKCSSVSVHHYKKEGLPYYKIGRKVLFRKTEVLNFMKSTKRKRFIQV